MDGMIGIDEGKEGWEGMSADDTIGMIIDKVK